MQYLKGKTNPHINKSTWTKDSKEKRRKTLHEEILWTLKPNIIASLDIMDCIDSSPHLNVNVICCGWWLWGKPPLRSRHSIYYFGSQISFIYNFTSLNWIKVYRKNGMSSSCIRVNPVIKILWICRQNYFSISTLYVHLNVPIMKVKLILFVECMTCIDDDEVILMYFKKICQSYSFWWRLSKQLRCTNNWYYLGNGTEFLFLT